MAKGKTAVSEGEKYCSRILSMGDSSDESWLKLEKEIRQWMETALEEEVDMVYESGAMEALSTICEAIRSYKN